MATDPSQVSQGSPQQPQLPSTAELIRRLSQFDGPPEQFLINLLAVQCHLAAAQGGAVLRGGGEGKVEILASFPPTKEGQTTLPVWLAQSAEMAPGVLEKGVTAITPLHDSEEMYGQPAQRYLILVPLHGDVGVRGVEAFVTQAGNRDELVASRERLEISTSLLSLYEMRLTLQRRRIDMTRLRTAMETLSAVNEHDRFAGAAMALCNEVSSRWQCERVSLGFLKGRYVKLRALSHTEKFSRKMKLAQDIEASMEECLDQDIEIFHPAPPEATFVSRATSELATKHGPSTIVAMPLRRAGEVSAVLLAERRADQPFSLEEVESLRLTADLCTARVWTLEESDRWFGAKAAGAAKQSLAFVVGPKHTWIKIAAVVVFAAALFLSFVHGEYRVDAPFRLDATVRQVVTAPFSGILQSAIAEVGTPVEAGDVLATLKTAELKIELAKKRAEQLAYLKQADSAWNQDKRAEAQIAKAQADSLAQDVKLLEYRIEQAKIVAPITGLVVAGDWERQIGMPIETGSALFEVAPLDALRAELSIVEDDIADVLEAKARADADGEPLRGELATASDPATKIPFIVDRINPVAEVVDQRNVFKVRVILEDSDPELVLRPGLEGLAKVSIGERTYGWMLTRKLVNWLRMKLWW